MNDHDAEDEGIGEREPTWTRGDPYAITSETIETMRRTRPWVLVLGVLGLMGSVALILGAISTVYAGWVRGLERSPVVGAVLGVIGVALLCGSVGLLSYAKRLSAFAAHPDGRRLDEALAAQQRLWRAVGIAAATGVALYAVWFVYSLVAGLASR